MTGGVCAAGRKDADGKQTGGQTVGACMFVVHVCVSECICVCMGASVRVCVCLSVCISLSVHGHLCLHVFMCRNRFLCHECTGG